MGASVAFALLYSLVPILVLGGIGFAIWRAAAGRTTLTFPGVLAAYFHLVTGVSLIVLLSGLTLLLTAAWASLFGPEFSYRPNVAIAAPAPAAKPAAVAASKPAASTGASANAVAAPAQPPTPVPTPTASPEVRERQRADANRQQREGLAQGISLSAVAAILFALHWFGRRNLLPRLGYAAGTSRAYLGLMLAVFSLTGVIALPVAAAQVSTFLTAPPPPPGTFNQPQPPGGSLALALAVIPFWAAFLWSVTRAARRPEPGATTPTIDQ